VYDHSFLASFFRLQDYDASCSLLSADCLFERQVMARFSTSAGLQVSWILRGCQGAAVGFLNKKFGWNVGKESRSRWL
jgi:hypothetical protein